MEAPRYYTKAERVIANAMDEQHKALAKGVCGASMQVVIANALVKEGLLPQEDHPEHNHWGTEILPETCEVCATYVTA